MPRHSTPTGQELTVAQRRARVVNKRIDGATVREIAKDLGMTIKLVRADLRYSLTAAKRESREELLELEIRRADSVRAVLHDVIHSGGFTDGSEGGATRYTDVLKGIEVMLKVQERVAKYAGLDATREDTAHSEVDEWVNGIIGGEQEELDEIEELLGTIRTDDDELEDL